MTALGITSHAEPIMHVDATPDAGYPLRILRAYLENCERVGWSGTNELLVAELNAACRKRAELLRGAIGTLEQAHCAATEKGGEHGG
ncbi:MAG: hypothetical protein U0990_09675 [Candidatus Nanopelagicales bacterium]|nr:hypothetical protein [Candidatus Nanopelagicales bacterium]